jgi:hypothetical protein
LEEEEADKDRVLVVHPPVVVQSVDILFRMLVEHRALV